MGQWLDWLEVRFGKFAVPHPIRAVVFLNALAFVLEKMHPGFTGLLVLDRERFLAGEYWRLVSFLFVPPSDSMIWIVLALMFLWFVGDGLEDALGSFKLNLYYMLGAAGTALSAIFLSFDGATATYLNISLLYAFATLFPDYKVLFLFFIPMKIKWIAVASAVLLGVGFVGSPNSARISLLVSFANYFIFFGPGIVRGVAMRREAHERRKKFEAKIAPETPAFHTCSICQRTDESDPDLEFRVARDGREYCREHLPTFSAQA